MFARFHVSTGRNKVSNSNCGLNLIISDPPSYEVVANDRISKGAYTTW
jgi:hypothetical protein